MTNHIEKICTGTGWSKIGGWPLGCRKLEGIQGRLNGGKGAQFGAHWNAALKIKKIRILWRYLKKKRIFAISFLLFYDSIWIDVTK